MCEYRRRMFSILLVVIIIAMAACNPAGSREDPESEPPAGLANPAAVYCEGLGYTMEPRDTAAGADAACIFPDGKECAQWDFLSGRCGVEYSFCSKEGGELSDEGTNIGKCVFNDGSTCDEYMFFEGKCKPGDNPAEN